MVRSYKRLRRKKFWTQYSTPLANFEIWLRHDIKENLPNVDKNTLQDIKVLVHHALGIDLGIFPLIGIGNFGRGRFLMSEHNLWQNADTHNVTLGNSWILSRG